MDDAARVQMNERIDSMKTRVNKLAERLRLPDNIVGIVEDESVAGQLGEIYAALSSSTDEPTAGQLDELRRRDELLQAVLREVDAFFAGDAAAIRQELERAGVM
jgi:hypothetical protein